MGNSLLAGLLIKSHTSTFRFSAQPKEVFPAIATNSFTSWIDEQQDNEALFYIMALFLDPALGSLIGAYIVEGYENNWRYLMWLYCLSQPPLLFYRSSQKKTFKHDISCLKHKRLGLEPPHHAHWCCPLVCFRLHGL